MLCLSGKVGRGDPACPSYSLGWQSCIFSSLPLPAKVPVEQGRERICFKNNLAKMGKEGEDEWAVFSLAKSVPCTAPWSCPDATRRGGAKAEIGTACFTLPLWKTPQRGASVFHEAAQDVVSGRCITLSGQASCWIRLFIASEVTKRLHSLSLTFPFKYEAVELFFSNFRPQSGTLKRSWARSGIEQGLGFCTSTGLLHSFLLSPTELSDFSV